MSETPSIIASNYTSSAVDFDNLVLGNAVFGNRQFQDWGNAQQNVFLQQLQKPKPQDIMPNTNRRIVQVFIADPNENVPLEESVLFKGEQKLTDLTDTELFFEVPMAETLKAHNDKRVKWLDKDASKKAGKDVLLDPAKIRDLKMLVVTVAQF